MGCNYSKTTFPRLYNSSQGKIRARTREDAVRMLKHEVENCSWGRLQLEQHVWGGMFPCTNLAIFLGQKSG